MSANVLDLFGGEVSLANARGAAHAPAITLEQLQVFHAVAELGSFTAAARAQRRTQGSVSYHILGLEQQLGFALFDRSGRHISLTPEGTVVLARARKILEQIQDLRGESWALVRGVEACVSIGVDRAFPPALLARALCEMSARFPSVRTISRVLSRERVDDSLRAGEIDLAVTEAEKPPSSWRVDAGALVEMVIVVAPTHPLARHAGVAPGALSEHLEIACGPTLSTERASEQTASGPRWDVEGDSIRLELIRCGSGWARAPLHSVRDDLDTGRLVRLRGPGLDRASAELALAVVHRRDRPLGPAGELLRSTLARLN